MRTVRFAIVFGLACVAVGRRPDHRFKESGARALLILSNGHFDGTNCRL